MIWHHRASVPLLPPSTVAVHLLSAVTTVKGHYVAGGAKYHVIASGHSPPASPAGSRFIILNVVTVTPLKLRR